MTPDSDSDDSSDDEAGSSGPPEAGHAADPSGDVAGSNDLSQDAASAPGGRTTDAAGPAADSPAGDAILEETMTPGLKLSSPAFGDGQPIPKKYTCQGADVSPPLAWSGAPAGTKGFALIVDDPDAPDPARPKVVWVHWVLWGLGPETVALAENAAAALPAGAAQGKNDWGKPAWGGPCPPIGKHRYFFKLYALDVALTGLGQPTKAALLEAIKGHVLAQTQIIGTYQKE
jgi:Raf kinase inhibitor-like YbhB/YbcL family protein